MKSGSVTGHPRTLAGDNKHVLVCYALLVSCSAFIKLEAVGQGTAMLVYAGAVRDCDMLCRALLPTVLQGVCHASV